MDSRSLMPVFSDEQERVYQPDESIGMEAVSQRALFKGDYKLSRSGKPYGDDIWRLYHLASDPGDTNDLAEAQPDLCIEMLQDYHDYTVRYNVKEMPVGYEAVREVTMKLVRKLSVPVIIFGGFLIALFIILIGKRRIKKVVLS